MLKTVMQKKYMIKFVIRILIFIVIFTWYLLDKDSLCQVMTHRFTAGITTHGIHIIHILWLFFMLMMLSHIFPWGKVRTMALRKADKEQYIEVKDYSEFELLKYVQDQNIKAWKVMLIWLCFNAIWGVLYLFHVIDSADLLMLTVFYFLCDYICILVFCPFQTFIMKNKCCVNCRIYDWGHFMMFTPMLFIKNFFSWSLFFTALVVLLRWELIYAKNPQRFWEKSNKTLQCKHCQDKTCKMKIKI